MTHSNTEGEEIVADTEKALEIAAVFATVLENKEAKCDLMALIRPGTLIWTNTNTNERIYTRPGDALYSTAIARAEAYIDANGNECEFPE